MPKSAAVWLRSLLRELGYEQATRRVHAAAQRDAMQSSVS